MAPGKVAEKRHFKRICGSVQSIPFWDWKEHDQVGLALVQHRNDVASTEEALERVAVWKTRSAKIAHAIESTAALVQILLRDQQRSSLISTTELRHAYASAILRSVNGLADSLQQQRFAASSVAVLCAELGVPPWLVAIRHEATHNQLPLLPTLRMAAEALVQYFSTVYWEPIRERHAQQYENAWSILCQYEAAAIDREQSRRQTLSTEKRSDADCTRVAETNSESDEDHGVEEELEIDGLLQSPLGTTSNRFAALVEKKPKIDKAALQNDAPTEEPPLKKPKMELNDYVKHNQIVAACAKQFAVTEIPMDILHHVAIDFLIARSHENASSTNAARVDDDVLLQRFRMLLSTLGRGWPGFLSAFLQACVKHIVALECEPRNGNLPPEAGSIACSIFENWVHLLLSRKFLSLLERKTEKVAKANVKVNERTTFADFETLQSLQYPLNRICDELLGDAAMDSSFHRNLDLARYRLADVVINILGANRVPLYGIDMPIARALFCVPSNLKPQTTKPPVPASTMPFSMDSALTLEAMEAFLDDTNVGNTIRSLSTGSICRIDESDGSGESATKLPLCAKSPVWVQCQSWEPCAIGSFSCILK